MKLILLLFVLVLPWLPDVADAACTGASPTWNTTVDIASVRTCITNAQNGDTVNIAAGTATWTGPGLGSDCVFGGEVGRDKSFCLANGTHKYISIIGAGCTYNTAGRPTSCQTVITDAILKNGAFPASRVFDWILSPGGISRIAQIEFRGTVALAGCTGNTGILSISGDSGQFRVDHNRFIMHGNCPGMALFHNIRGVVDHNLFDISGHGDAGGNSGYCVYHHHDKWQNIGGYGDNSFAQPDTIGTVEAMYFEDNTFLNDQTLRNYGFCFDGWAGQRQVVRYNLFLGGPQWNTHGIDSGNSRGPRHHEIYNNQWLGPDGVSPWNMQLAGPEGAYQAMMGARGGSGTIFNNTISYTNGTWNKLVVYTANSERFQSTAFGDCTGNNPWDQNTTGQSGWLCMDQAGAGMGDLVQTEPGGPLCSGNAPRNVTLGCVVAWPRQVANPTYAWNNTMNGVSANADTVFPTYIQLGRDIKIQTRPFRANGVTPYCTDGNNCATSPPFQYPHPLIPNVDLPPAAPTGVTIQ